MVRSNTIVGDRFHANGMVVARIVKGKRVFDSLSIFKSNNMQGKLPNIIFSAENRIVFCMKNYT